MLRLKELDAISVCATNSMHATVTVDALRSGRHVLCEKPMATTLEDAAQMIEEAKKNDRILMLDHNQRFLGPHQKARAILKSGELGKILSFRTAFGYSGPETWSADKSRNTWFFKKNSAAMGAIGDLGLHKVDLIRWLTGDDIDEVCTALSTRDKRNDTGEMIEVDDNAVCLLKMKTGIIGSMAASWTYYGRSDNSTVFYCQNGVLRVLDDPEHEIIIERKEGQCEKLQPFGTQSNLGVIDSFVNSIITGTPAEISAEDGYEALSVIIACIESADKKSFVKVKHV